MTLIKEKEYQQICIDAAITQDEIDQACDSFALHDQIEKAKGMLSQILFKYSLFLASVSQEDKMNVVRNLGPRIATLEEALTKLQEAPE